MVEEQWHTAYLPQMSAASSICNKCRRWHNRYLPNGFSVATNAMHASNINSSHGYSNNQFTSWRFNPVANIIDTKGCGSPARVILSMQPLQSATVIQPELWMSPLDSRPSRWNFETVIAWFALQRHALAPSSQSQTDTMLRQLAYLSDNRLVTISRRIMAYV